jgi:hypothetical protein
LYLTWGGYGVYAGFYGIQNQLKNVKVIFSTEVSFAALTYEGNILTWGDCEGLPSAEIQNALQNSNIMTIIPSEKGFVFLFLLLN